MVKLRDRWIVGSGVFLCEMEGGEGGRKWMEAGRGRDMPGSEAFRCHGANLLPFTKFIGKGLFIK